LYSYSGAGSSAYSSLLGGTSLDIWHTGTQTDANLVAHLTISSGSFTFGNNVSFV